MTRSGGDYQPRPLKRLFTANQCRTSFLDVGGLRDIDVAAVTKNAGLQHADTGREGIQQRYISSNTSSTHAAAVPARPAEKKRQSCG